MDLINNDFSGKMKQEISLTYPWHIVQYCSKRDARNLSETFPISLLS